MAITTRPVVESDVAALARIHVDTWRTTYHGLIAQDYLDTLTYESKEEQWLRGVRNASHGSCRFVAEYNGVVAGFVIAGARTPDNLPHTSELYAMYVGDETQGRGIGCRLFEAAAAWLRTNGHNSMLIQVLRGNDKTIAFYESRGATLIGESQVELGAASYDQQIYGFDL